MMLIANKPMYQGAPTDWARCGDPIPSPEAGYSYVPMPPNSDTVLSLGIGNSYQTVPLADAGPAQYFQIAAPTKGPGVIECEHGGAVVIPCVTGLI